MATPNFEWSDRLIHWLRSDLFMFIRLTIIETSSKRWYRNASTSMTLTFRAGTAATAEKDDQRPKVEGTSRDSINHFIFTVDILLYSLKRTSESLAAAIPIPAPITSLPSFTVLTTANYRYLSYSDRRILIITTTTTMTISVEYII